MADSNSDSPSSITSVASTTIQPQTQTSQQVVFTIPNMNPNLHIKLSKGNFMAWKTQILTYIKGQDS
jgi:hypothetical protein